MVTSFFFFCKALYTSCRWFVDVALSPCLPPASLLLQLRSLKLHWTRSPNSLLLENHFLKLLETHIPAELCLLLMITHVCQRREMFFSIKIDESIYQQLITLCRSSLLAHVIQSKGKAPLKIQELRKRLVGI